MRIVAVADTHLFHDELAVPDVSFWGSPWQLEFNDWAFSLPRGAALADKWALIPDRVDRPGRSPSAIDVLITHGPPHGIGDRGPVKPRVHFFGHIHQDGGAWRHGETLFVNATTWECERMPTVIDLDASGATPIEIPPPRR